MPEKNKQLNIHQSFIIVLGFVFFLVFLLSARVPDNIPLISYFADKVNVALPKRLKIPSLNIDAAFLQVGLTSDGAMDVPKSPNDVAWFNLGTVPGENGSAAVVGHSGWRNDIPAMFDNLYKLRKGDKVYVVDETGAAITFIVRESRTYKPLAYAPDVFHSDDGNAHLNLITCTGDWDKVEKTHSNRLVVFTDKEQI